VLNLNGIKIILIIFNILLILSTVFAHGFAFTASQTSSPLCPRESGLFKDIIKNTDTTSKQFSVSLSGGAAQFSTVFPNSFILAAGEEKEIYSYVTPRTETQPGTYELSINFASGSDTHSINHPVIVKDCYGVGLTTDQTTATVCPSEISRFELTVRNNGEYSETYSLSAEGQIMDRISLSDNQVILNKGESKKVIAFVNTPSESGKFGFSVNLDTASKKSRASLPLFLDVKPCFDFNFKVQSDKTSYEVCDRTATPVQLRVENLGTTRNEFDIVVEGPEWVRLTRNSIGLSPNEVRFIDLFLVPDFGVEGDYKIKINLIPKKGILKATSQLDVKVKKCSGIDLQILNKKVNACKGITNDFQVKAVNTGQLEKSFQASLTGPEWVTFNSVPQFSAKPGVEKTLVIRASPPDDASEEGHKIKVSIKASDESSVIANDEQELEIEVVGINNCYKPSVVSKYTDAIIYYDSNIPIPVTITNNGNRRADYNLFLTGNAANFARLSPTSLSLDAGKSETVLVYVAPDVNVELGNYNVILTVNLLNGPVLESKEFNFEITGTREKATQVEGTNNLGNNTEETKKLPISKIKDFVFANKFPIVVAGIIIILLILVFSMGWHKSFIKFFEDEESEEVKEEVKDKPEEKKPSRKKKKPSEEDTGEYKSEE